MIICKHIGVLILVMVNFKISTQFYLRENDAITYRTKETKKIVDDFKINITTPDGDEFPLNFFVEFTDSNNQTNRVYFTKIADHDTTHPIHSANIYTVDEVDEAIKELNPILNNHEKWRLYREVNGKSVATLIRNKVVLIESSTETSHTFRLIATIHDKFDNVYEIYPINRDNSSGRRKRSTPEIIYDSVKNAHVISFTQDYVPSNLEEKLSRKSFKQGKMRLSTLDNPKKPIELNVELLLVTDSSIYEDHKRFLNSDNKNYVFLHMRIYFAHFINGINHRYQNSFSNDPDLRINIKLKNFLFLTKEIDSNWTNPDYVGISTVKSYKNRTVLLSESTLDAFRDFMNNKSFKFSYDIAIGLLNKDLWSSSGTDVKERSSIVGFSYQGKVCSDFKYAIIEEIGGFVYMSIAAHEIGHILGLDHDGDMNLISNECSPFDNYLMTPTIGSNSNNLTNLHKLSRCSIKLMKKIFLTDDLMNTTEAAQCLLNLPEIDYENKSAEFSLHAGQIWSPDDQCKMIYGSNATFCHFLKNQLCTSIACRVSSTDPGCVFLNGNGAVEGTVCDSGKTCQKGSCLESKDAPHSDCLFGDDIVVNLQVIKDPLPYSQMTCEQVLNYLESVNQFPIIYCTIPLFRQTCCATCKKYESLKCVDKHMNCPQYKILCDSTALFDGEPIKNVCARTCGVCSKQPLSCSNETVTCLNGGTCVNIQNITDSEFIGYECMCAPGYYGYLCELKNPCEPNPCGEGHKCERIGSFGHECTFSKLNEQDLSRAVIDLEISGSSSLKYYSNLLFIVCFLLFLAFNT